MNSLTFATSANKDDIFGGFKSLSAIEENKSAGRAQEGALKPLTQPKLV